MTKREMGSFEGQTVHAQNPERLFPAEHQQGNAQARIVCAGFSGRERALGSETGLSVLRSLLKV